MPKLQLGHALVSEALLRRRADLLPRVALQHRLRPAQPLVGRGIAPVLGCGDPAALDGIVVQVLQFLPHDLIVRNGLRMGALLPELILIGLVRGAVVAELVEQPVTALGLQLREQLPGGVAFEIALSGGEIGRRRGWRGSGCRG